RPRRGSSRASSCRIGSCVPSRKPRPATSRRCHAWKASGGGASSPSARRSLPRCGRRENVGGMSEWTELVVDDDAGLRAILRTAKSVAVIGAKIGAHEPAYYVPAYLAAREIGRAHVHVYLIV